MKLKNVQFINIIRTTILLIIVTVFAILGCVAAMYYQSQQREQNDNIIIDVFVRQRMLSQSISKDASRYYTIMLAVESDRINQTPEAIRTRIEELRESLGQARDEFSETLLSMHNGILVSGSQRFDIRGRLDAAEPEINEIGLIWGEYAKAVDTLLDEGALNERSEKALVYINEHNQNLLDLSEKVLSIMIEESLDASRAMQTLLLVLISLLSVVMLISFISLFKYIVTPYERLYQGIADIGLADTRSRRLSGRKAVQSMVDEVHDMFQKINVMFTLIENMNNNVSFEDMLSFINRAFSAFIPYNYIGVALFDKNKEKLIASYGVSDGTVIGMPQNLVGKTARLDQTSLGDLIISGKPRIINDLESYVERRPHREYNDIILKAGIRASITLPLKLVDGPVGVIFFSSTTKHVYNEEHTRFLKVLVNSIAVSFRQNIFIRDLLLSSILALAKLAEARDEDTGEHLDRMKTYARAIAEFLYEKELYPEITYDYIERIERFSPLHDIGKVGIRDGILLKQGRLTVEEFREMQRHPLYGADVLRAAEAILMVHGKPLFTMGIEIAEDHHEKWDGSGYPGGKKGHEIALSARIVAVADVFDALTSNRPYKKAFPFEESFRMILDGSGSHFDPQIVQVFEENKEKIREIYESFHHE